MATIMVSSSAELYAALAHASGGDVIALASGEYGSLKLSSHSGFNVSFPSNVTITSADPLHPAVLTGLELSDVSNLTIDSVVCDYRYAAGDPIYTTPFSVYGGSNITIRNSTFDGAITSGVSAEADGYGYATGLSVTGTTGLRVEGNEFFDFNRGLAVMNSSGVTIAGNDVHGIRSDGMDFAQVQGIAITGNHIHDFHTNEASGDHPDMIQFWTSGTTAPSTDITISGNVLDAGTGAWTQSIFMGNELVSQGLAGSEMYYRNVTITDNLITNGQYHGITVGQAAGVTIDGNSVLHTDGATPDGADSNVEIPQINVDAVSTGVTVTHNITAALNGWSGQSGWVVGQNAFVQDQDPGAPGYYGDVFITSSLTAQDGQHQFLALPGGMIDLLGAGATATREYLPAPGTVAALFQAVTDPDGSVQTRTFDASLSLGDTGNLPVGTTFTWTFGDGTSATGMKVMHHFAEGGHYDVALTVTLPTGVSDTVVGTVGVQDRDLATLGSDGMLRVEEYESTILLPGGTSAGIQLGAVGVAVTLGSQYVSDLTRVHDFDIAMRLDAASTASTGEVFRLHGSVVAQVDSAGKLVVQSFDQSLHMVQLTSGAVSVTDLKAHDIDLKLHDGSLQLWVDGKMTDSAAFTGSLNSFANTDLTFGNPWGGKNFAGDVTAFDVKIGENALVQDKTIVSLSPDGSFLTAASSQGYAIASGTSGAGLHLTEGVAATIKTTLLTDLLQGSDWDISMRLDSDTMDAKGNVFRLHNTFFSRVNDMGQFVVFATNSAGQTVRLATIGLDASDMNAHDFDIRLANGKLQLWADGTLSAQTNFSGTLHSPDVAAMAFGNTLASPYTNFHGIMSAFDVSVAAADAWMT